MKLRVDLKELEKNNLITSLQAEQIKAFCAQKTSSFNPLLIIASLLIALGIISLFAYNWDYFSPEFKSFVGVFLLILAGSIGILHPNLSKSSKVAVEIFWFLSTFASLAIVAQSYHMGGSLQGFMLTCLVLNLPVVIAFKSQSLASIFIALIGLNSFFWQGQMYLIALVLAAAIIIFYSKNTHFKILSLSLSVSLLLMAFSLAVKYKIFTNIISLGLFCGLFLVLYFFLYRADKNRFKFFGVVFVLGFMVITLVLLQVFQDSKNINLGIFDYLAFGVLVGLGLVFRSYARFFLSLALVVPAFLVFDKFDINIYLIIILFINALSAFWYKHLPKQMALHLAMLCFVAVLHFFTNTSFEYKSAVFIGLGLLFLLGFFVHKKYNPLEQKS